MRTTTLMTSRNGRSMFTPARGAPYRFVTYLDRRVHCLKALESNPQMTTSIGEIAQLVSLIIFWNIFWRWTRNSSTVWNATKVDWRATLYLLHACLGPVLGLLNAAHARSTRLYHLTVVGRNARPDMLFRQQVKIPSRDPFDVWIVDPCCSSLCISFVYLVGIWKGCKLEEWLRLWWMATIPLEYSLAALSRLGLGSLWEIISVWWPAATAGVMGYRSQISPHSSLLEFSGSSLSFNRTLPQEVQAENTT